MIVINNNNNDNNNNNNNNNNSHSINLKIQSHYKKCISVVKVS